MDRLYLGDHEVSYYFDLFDTYDPAQQGRIQFDHAVDLFKRAKLQPNVLHTILLLCGASKQTHFNRIQFLTALKLIALAQAEHEVTMGALRLHGRTLPLPTFSNKPTDNSFPAHALLSSRTQSAYSNEVAQHYLNTDDTGTLSEISTQFSTDNSSQNDWCGDIRPYAPHSPPTTTTKSTVKWANFEDIGNQTASNAKKSTNLPSRHSSSENEDDTWHAVEESLHPEPVESKKTPYKLLTESSKPIRLEHGVWTPNFTQTTDSVHSSFISEDRIIDIPPFRTQTFANSLSATTNNFAGLSIRSESNQPINPDMLRFWLHPSKENEYATQFYNLLSPSERINENPSLSLSRVRLHFSKQYHISNVKVDEIWRLADLDRDSLLNKAEFCLASHLAHLHGHERLSINDAVSVTASYIAKRIPVLDTSHRDAPVPGRLPPPPPSTQHSPPCNLATEVLDNSDEEQLISQNDNDQTESPSLPNLRTITSIENSSSTSSASSSSAHSSSSASASSRSISETSRSSSSSCGTLTTTSYDESEGTFDIDGPPTQSGTLLNEGRNRKHKHCDPIRLLAATLNRPYSCICRLPVGRRRRLLNAIIREAKNVNHSLLRLNNELHGEWAELKDQRVNISAQLQHLGLLPSID